ncbi:MAG TPA: arylamine N-acetyltransferase, partial [Thermoanaerobaculia bacterium]|nr:arylamine N-acetyltransferase [Thermoanaerobaculia bacterium]
PGFLQALFTLFNERIPFETASKILRNAQVLDPQEKPRRPGVFWSEHLEWGAGGTCFARVAAFEALLSALGFQCRRVLGSVEADFDHAAILVQESGEQWLCDVGFPLPAVFLLVDGEVETGFFPVRLTRTHRGWRVELTGGVPEGPRALEIFDSVVEDEEFEQSWRRTFLPGSRFVKSVSLRRQQQGRIVSFSGGELRIDDRHSRTRIPVLGSRPAVLEEQFGVGADRLARAFALAGDPGPEISSAQVNVYLETDVSPEVAFEAIVSPQGYGRLMEGVGEVKAGEGGEGSWQMRLSLPARAGQAPASLEERITPDAAARTLRVKRGSEESSYGSESRAGRTYLVRRAILSGPREDLLRNDSLRGRLAGTLALDLLAWARMLKRS